MQSEIEKLKSELDELRNENTALKEQSVSLEVKMAEVEELKEGKFKIMHYFNLTHNGFKVAKPD